MRARTPLENFEVNLMDFEVAGPGEAPPPTRPNQWAPWEPRLPRGIAQNFEMGCWVGQEHLRHWEGEEFNFLIEGFCLFLEEPTIGICVSGKTINSGMCSSRSGMRLLLPRQRPRSLSPGTSAPHSFLPGRDAEAELAAAVEEGILEAAKQASLEIRTKGAPKVDSWFKSTDLWGPAVCPAPAGHGMYCPANYPCRTQQDSELQELKDQMQLFVHTLGRKNISKTHMQSEGASSVGKGTEPSEEAIEFFSIAPSVDSKTTDARISRSKLKERGKISSSESRTEKAGG